MVALITDQPIIRIRIGMAADGAGVVAGVTGMAVGVGAVAGVAVGAVAGMGVGTVDGMAAAGTGNPLRCST
jgi:hypothetical protein